MPDFCPRGRREISGIRRDLEYQIAARCFDEPTDRRIPSVDIEDDMSDEALLRFSSHRSLLLEDPINRTPSSAALQHAYHQRVDRLKQRRGVAWQIAGCTIGCRAPAFRMAATLIHTARSRRSKPVHRSTRIRFILGFIVVAVITSVCVYIALSRVAAGP